MPALAARLPFGATYITTGTREARIAWIISRVEDSSPPGVSRRTITAGAPWAAARSSAFASWPAETKPIAPLMSMRSTGRSGALLAEQHRRRAEARTQMHSSAISQARTIPPSIA